MANRLEKTVNVTAPPEAPGGGSGGSGGSGGVIAPTWTCADAAAAQVKAMFLGPDVLVGASGGLVTAYRITPNGTQAVAVYGYHCTEGSVVLNMQPFGVVRATGGGGGVG